MVVMKSLFPSQKLFLILGFACVFVLALACAKSAEEAAKPAPAPAAPAAPKATPAPGAPAAPVAAAVPPKPLTAEEAIVKYAEGQPLVPGGPAFFPRKLLATSGYQLHLKYHQTKLPLWEKAVYGGEMIGNSTARWQASLNVLDLLSLSRVVYTGMLLSIDMGRCTMVGREGQFDRCNGQYAKNYELAIIPMVLQRWEQPSPTEYVFRVRSGVLWPAHALMKRADRGVTAEDIAWYLNVVKKEGILKDNFDLVDKIEAVDRSTVKITMKVPQVEFLRHMANTSMGIIPKECYDDKDCKSGQFTISPAPFLHTPEKSTLLQKWTITKNPEFYLKGLPYLDAIVGIAIADPAAVKAAFITKKIDQMYLNRQEELEAAQKQVPDLWVHSSWVLAGNPVLRPQLKGPLADVRVRRAMAMTMDLPSVWEATFSGHTLFPNLVSRDVWGAEWYYTLEQAGENYQLNPQKAKQLMKEAGYADGFEVIFSGWTWSGFSAPETIATVLQANWKKHLNLDVKISKIDFVAYNKRQYDSTWDGVLYQNGWNITYWAGQEEPLIHMMKGARLNLQKIDDPKIREMYDGQRGEFNPAKRAALLWEFEQYELSQVYFFRIAVLTAFDVGQAWEMNGASHQVTWYGPFNSPSWVGMFDPSKTPKR